MGKRIDQLTAASDTLVNDSTSLWAVGDPATGQLYKATRSQIAAAFGAVTPYKYTSTGSEGTTITIGALAGAVIKAIFREGSVLYEVDSSPDEVEFIWDSTDITLGQAVNYAGERFLILYTV